MQTRVKICGLRTPEDVNAAVSAGADYLGFNFFPKSPRYVDPAAAGRLAGHVPAGIAKVALVVDASDEELDALTGAAPFDMVQLHGKETPERVSEIKRRYGLPVMKVLGVAGPGDLAALDLFQSVADQILVDAKAPKGSVLPGGNGIAFDWRLLLGRVWRKPWMLAGGLTPANVAEAIRATNARQVDVASGVESSPGQKDAELVRAFIAAARR
ncbi:MAG: phosphoribosylanthranilate isomerase [Rhodobacteraceae bacterium]|nr:phosphoribosylanthranilate isomerase [Paracoccaceae bacterium]